jgi:DNA-binding transcriptional LysR family regulator
MASPAYWARHSKPDTPQELMAHNCINIRLPTQGGLYAWEFEKDGRELRMRVEGQLILNSIIQIRQAAVDGLGVACLSEEFVKADIVEGRLVPVLSDWSTSFSGYHLYYPSRRQHTPAFKILTDALRYRAASASRGGPQDSVSTSAASDRIEVKSRRPRKTGRRASPPN